MATRTQTRRPLGTDRKKVREFMGTRIRIARELAGLTQSELGEALGFVTPGGVSSVELGRTALDAADLQVIAERTGLPIAWFLDPAVDPSRPDWPTTIEAWLKLSGGDVDRANMHFSLEQLLNRDS